MCWWSQPHRRTHADDSHPAGLLHDQLSAPAAAAGVGDDRRAGLRRDRPRRAARRLRPRSLCARRRRRRRRRRHRGRLRPAGPLDQRRHRRPERHRSAPTAAPPRPAPRACSSRSPPPPGRAHWCCPAARIDHTPIDTLEADLDRVAAELVAAAGTAAAHGVELWTESLHFHRLCFNIERAQQLTSRLDHADDHVGIVMDFSHIVASGGDPVEFVEPLRPAHRACPHPRRGAGQHQPVGRQRRGRLRPRPQGPGRRRLPGHFSLELETRDITHDERPAAAAKAGQLISDLI